MSIPTKTQFDYIQSGDSVDATTEANTLQTVEDNIDKIYTALDLFEQTTVTLNTVGFVFLPSVNDSGQLVGQYEVVGTDTLDVSSIFSSVNAVLVTSTTSGVQSSANFTGTTVSLAVGGGGTETMNIMVVGQVVA